jgi:hypothetical protein
MIASAQILRDGYAQAKACHAPGEMLNRLRLAAEWAETHLGQLPPWLDLPTTKTVTLPVLREEESP